MKSIVYGLAVMSPGVAFLVMLAAFAVLVAGLMASGIISIRIEIEEDEPKKPRNQQPKDDKISDRRGNKSDQIETAMNDELESPSKDGGA